MRNPKEFVRKHWLDIMIIAFLPLFAGFKIAKMAIKVVKGAKLASQTSRHFWVAKSYTRRDWPRDERLIFAEFLAGLKDVDYADAPKSRAVQFRYQSGARL